MRTTLIAQGLLIAVLSVGQALAQLDHSHSEWTALLAENVALDGAISRVDYQAMGQGPELRSYLKSLSAVTKADFKSWDGDRRLAFLINAYNAFTVKLIADNYPVESIKDLGGWFATPWKKDFFELLGEARNLDDVEHGMIRADFEEPRIHFAVNCAALGCPPLRREAYVADRLDEQLADSTRIFLNDRRRNSFDRNSNTLKLSPIFNWYKRDFVSKHGSIEAFVALYLDDPSARTRVASRSVRVVFLDYDWALNDLR